MLANTHLKLVFVEGLHWPSDENNRQSWVKFESNECICRMLSLANQDLQGPTRVFPVPLAPAIEVISPYLKPPSSAS